MERRLTDELTAHIGERVRLLGWVHHQRQLAQVTFLLLRDRKGIAQVVLVDPELRQMVHSLGPESVIEVQGEAVRSEQAPGGIEIAEPTIAVVSRVDVPAPVELRRPRLNAQLPTLLDHAAVSLRHPPRRAVAEIAAASARGFRTSLDALGFTEIFTPKVVTSATESGASVFPIDWFGTEAYLAQSPQLYKQVMVGVLERVYEVAPVFRAEPHDTARHLAEYVSLDVEIGFIDGHRDVIALLETVLHGMVDAIAESAQPALGVLGLTLPSVPRGLPVVDFLDAQQMIESATGRPTLGEPDLAPADERWLSDWALHEHGSELVVVEGQPMAKRPFYTQPDPSDPERSRSFDLLFRGIELVTGGQRRHRVEDYEAALAGQDHAALEGYLEAFRHGMPPHGGFAIGLERWVARLVGAANVREVALFPRDRNRLVP